jgi:hypothetical protein
VTELDLDPHEWRLKGSKRIKPFKKQPEIPRGREAYSRPIFTVLAIMAGLWAAVVIIWAHANPGQNPWMIGPLSMGPGLLMLALMILRDD